MADDYTLACQAFVSWQASNASTVIDPFNVYTASTYSADSLLEPAAQCIEGYDMFRTPVVANLTTPLSSWTVTNNMIQRTPIAEKDRNARKLMWEWLDDHQRETFKACGCFYAWSDGGRCYLVTESTVELIEVHERPGKPRSIMCFCFHPDLDFSRYDRMLTQKLWIESDEEAFLRGANVDEIWDWRDTPEGRVIRAAKAQRVIDLAAGGTPVIASAVIEALDVLAMEKFEEKAKQFEEAIGMVANGSPREVHTIEEVAAA